MFEVLVFFEFGVKQLLLLLVHVEPLQRPIEVILAIPLVEAFASKLTYFLSSMGFSIGLTLLLFTSIVIVGCSSYCNFTEGLSEQHNDESTLTIWSRG